jgi:hypothetical protein
MTGRPAATDEMASRRSAYRPECTVKEDVRELSADEKSISEVWNIRNSRPTIATLWTGPIGATSYRLAGQKRVH